MFRTANKKIACTPFPTTDTKIEVKGGLAHIKQKQELVRLAVVYDTEDMDGIVGMYVWVRGDACKHDNAKTVFEVEPGKPFVLIGYEQVVATDYEGGQELPPACDEHVNECEKLHLV